MYNTYLVPSNMISSLYSRLTSHMMSTNGPSVFNRTNLSSGSLACRYAPGTSNHIATSLSSWASINSVVINVSSAIVGDDCSLWSTVCASSALNLTASLFFDEVNCSKRPSFVVSG